MRFIFLLVFVLFFSSILFGEDEVTKNNVKTDLFKEKGSSFLGARYGYGLAGQNNRFDCSGLVTTMIKSVVCDASGLPRSSQDLYRFFPTEISLEDAEIGDLLFFKNNMSGHNIDHVALYWGRDKNNNHLMLHASSSRGVQIVAFQSDSYWRGRLVGVKRYNKLYKMLKEE